MVLQEGVTVKGKSLKEHFEAKNHETAIHKLYKLVHKDYVLNTKDLLELHGLVLRSIEDDFAGPLRNAGGVVFLVLILYRQMRLMFRTI